MRINTLKFKELVEYLSLNICNCEIDLTVWDRERTPPMVSTVYLLLDDDGTVLRVGQTNNLRRRLAQLVNNPKVQRLKWTQFAFFSPQIKNVHIRLQVETTLATICCPPGNGLVALRRKADGTWREVSWSVKNAEKQRREEKLWSVCPHCNKILEPDTKGAGRWSTRR